MVMLLVVVTRTLFSNVIVKVQPLGAECIFTSAAIRATIALVRVTITAPVPCMLIALLRWLTMSAVVMPFAFVFVFAIHWRSKCARIGTTAHIRPSTPGRIEHRRTSRPPCVERATRSCVREDRK